MYSKLSDLKKEIDDLIEKDGDRNYIMTAAYGAEGDIEKIYIDREKGHTEGFYILQTNICTG